jgi:hypothetical protein
MVLVALAALAAFPMAARRGQSAMPPGADVDQA